MKQLTGNIKNIISFLEQFAVLILWVLALIVIGIVAWALDKGIVFSDESYYLLQLNPKHFTDSSHWARYVYYLFPTTELLLLRITTVCLLILSATIFSFGFTSYFKNIDLKLVLPLSLLSIFIFSSPVQLTPNYITFNSIIFCSGSGFFLMSLGASSVKNKIIKASIAGLFISQLTFIMITNLPIYAILLTLPFFLNNKKTAFFSGIGLISGSLLGLTLFFLLILPLPEFIKSVFSTTAALDYDHTHGMAELLRWTYGVLLYFIREVIVASSIVFIILSKKISDEKTNQYLKIILIIFLAYIIRKDIVEGTLNIASPTPIYILLIGLLIYSHFEKNKAIGSLSIFFLSIPFFASLGTDVGFAVRSAGYIMPMFVFLFYIFQSLNSKYFFLILLLILLTNVIRFGTQFIQTSGWTYTLINQSIPITDIGRNQNANIKIDESKHKILAEIATHIPSHTKALPSANYLWGYIYLLNLDAPILYYGFNEKSIQKILSKNPIQADTLYLIEHANRPFPQKTIIRDLFLYCDTIKLLTNKNITIYKLFSNQQ